MESGTPKQKRTLNRFFIIAVFSAVGLLALAETFFTFYFAGPQISEVQWKKASTRVHAGFATDGNDLLLFSPRWLGPLGRKHMGDLLTLKQVSRPTGDTYSRIWVVGTADRAENAQKAALKNARPIQHWTFGDLQVQLWQRTPAQITYDFYEKLDRAAVYLTALDDRRLRRCPYQPQTARFACGPGWNNVRQTLAEVDYTLKRCIYAHPVEHKKLVISYPSATLGDRLVIHTGLHGYDNRFRARNAVYERKKNPQKHPRGPKRAVPITLTVRVADTVVATLRHPLTDRWLRHDVSLAGLQFAGAPAGDSSANEAPASARARTVTFTVHTRWAYGKVFCFYAQSRSKK
jgi:hypothetical protein